MPNQSHRRYGWRPDLPDHRDLHFRLAMAAPEPPPGLLASVFPCFAKKKPPLLPTYVDLTAKEKAPLWPAIFDQGQLGSCTAQAHVAAWAYQLALEGEEPRDRVLSRLLLYGEERHWVLADVGASIRDGIKAMSRVGDCPERLWPYVEDMWAQRPPASAYVPAAKRKAITYARLSTLQDMRQCLADGHPFVGGFSVYEAFEGLNSRNSTLPMPKPGDTLLGGHAVCFVGYDDSAKAFRVRNSWGTDWGNVGYFWMPYAYATDSSLADDFWTTRFVPSVPGDG